MPDKSGLPTRVEMASLPRWARVAFAARCARRVEPILLAAKLEADRSKVTICGWTWVAEDSAAKGQGFPKPVHDHEAEMARVAVDFGPPDAAQAAAAAAAAHDASFSDATGADTTAAAVAAATAASNAAPTDDDKIRIQIRRDFESLKCLAVSEGWTEGTPVPPTVFGEMWPDGAPDWAREVPEQVMNAEALKQAYGIHVGDRLESSDSSVQLPAFGLWLDPGSASIATLQSVLVALSELHIAAGGGGLEFKPDGDFLHVRELVKS